MLRRRKVPLPDSGAVALHRFHQALDHHTPELRAQLQHVRQDLAGSLDHEQIARDTTAGVIGLDQLEQLHNTTRRSIQIHVFPTLQSIAGRQTQRIERILGRQADNLARSFSSAAVATLRDVIGVTMAQQLDPATTSAELPSLIGLARQQARSVQRYRRSVTASSGSSTATEQAERMASRLFSSRAATLATTELATAYHLGQYVAFQNQAISRIALAKTDPLPTIDPSEWSIGSLVSWNDPYTGALITGSIVDVTATGVRVLPEGRSLDDWIVIHPGEWNLTVTMPVQQRQQRAIWRTAEDELVCPLCYELDGKQVVAGFLPPLHPNCRCVIDYLLW